jgi:hypothetical protein
MSVTAEEAGISIIAREVYRGLPETEFLADIAIICHLSR